MTNARRPALHVGFDAPLDAHYARKRSTQWVGYKIHLTETCEEGLPLSWLISTSGPAIYSRMGIAAPVVGDSKGIT